MKKTTLFSGSVLLAGAMALFINACAGDGAGGATGGSGGSSAGGSSGGKAGSSTNFAGTAGSSSFAGSGGAGSQGTAGAGVAGSSGGSQGTAGAGVAGAGGSVASGNGLITMGGFYTSGTLKGYFFTAADTGGSTVSPKDYSIDGKICASGTAAMVAGMAYDTTWGAMLGWNVNQAALPPNPVMTVALSTTGKFTLNLTGTVPPGTRFKVRVGTDDYCTNVTTGVNTILMSDLKKSCWLPMGTAYAGQPIDSVAVQVTTNTTSSSMFSFCIADISYMQ